ncbi:stalk domain-containing protein [Natranaerobius trueperi]|uniref:SCP domain-containing protein n=1 Tax=Natranaerobius trueperi TaxID=759412 RepID=A0A226BUX8_9FIRM|nr:stalk domain-containing protein [Natranaerobius trueperi]OWZ82681.1 hypothetical protein CDO51_12770 [Natranaerobius trueperi]
MLKKSSIIFSLLFLLVLSSSVMATPEDITLEVNGSTIEPDVPPQIIDSRTMVPLRVISENLNTYVEWDSSTQSVLIVESGTNINNPLTSAREEITIIVNNNIVNSDVFPKIIESRTLVPLRFIGEALEAYVNWHEDENKVTVHGDFEENEQPKEDNQQDSDEDNWTLEHYNQYNASNFRNSNLLNESINYENIDYPRLNAAIFYATNEIRKEYNLSTVKHSKNLEIAAWNHSISMAKHDFFSHYNEHEDSRHSPEDRGRLAGIDNPSIAENLAQTTSRNDTYLSFADTVIDMWMGSEGHRQNMLSASPLQLGTGAYVSNNNQFGPTIIATQKFQWFNEIDASESSDPSPYDY